MPPLEYAGNPANNPTAVDIPTGGDTPSTNSLQPGFKGTLDKIAWIQQTLYGAATAANWNPWSGNPGAVGSGDTWWLSCACWDSYYGVWLVGGAVSSGGGTMKLLGSTDGGKTWITNPPNRTFPSSGGAPFVIACSPTTGTICSWFASGGTFYVCRMSAGNPACPYVAQAAPLSPYSFGVLVNMGDSNSTFHFIGLSQSGGSYTGTWLSGGVDGQGVAGVWASGGGLPSGWGNGTGNVLCLLAATDAQPATAFTPAAAATTWIVALCGVAGGTDPSRLLLNGSDVTPAFAAAKAIRGLAYCAATQLWGVLVFDPNTFGNSYLYTTQTPSNPASWTLAHTFEDLFCSGLAVVGNLWATTFNLNNPSPGPNNGVAYSMNVVPGSTSSTWSVGDYGDPVPMAPPTLPFTETRMISNGGQFLRLAVGGGGDVSTPGIAGGAVAVSRKYVSQPIVGGV